MAPLSTTIVNILCWLCLTLPKIEADTGEGGRLVNVASNGGTCTASSEYSYEYACSLAIDGNINTEWASAGEGVGAWLKIDFAGPSRILLVRVMQRFNAVEQFEDVSLTFSDGTAQTVTLAKRTGSAFDDESGRWWDTVHLDYKVSSFLKIKALTVYSVYNNGLREVEVWARAV